MCLSVYFPALRDSTKMYNLPFLYSFLVIATITFAGMFTLIVFRLLSFLCRNIGRTLNAIIVHVRDHLRALRESFKIYKLLYKKNIFICCRDLFF